jgi:hypothetical protein
MPFEYSYFRAEGASLDAIETVEESKKEYEAQCQRLCKKFGAEDAWPRFDADTGRLTKVTFNFGQAENPPEGWIINNRQMSYDEKSQVALFAQPAPGSADEFHVASIGGLMERSFGKSRLEKVFGTGEMPMKELPAGEYRGEFVRATSFKDRADTRPVGRLPDNVTGCFGSNCAIRSSDLIAAMQLDGQWYLRIPNKKGTEEPVFTPPDAVPVPFDDMLALDRKEYDARNDRFRNNYRGPIC